MAVGKCHQLVFYADNADKLTNYLTQALFAG